VSIQRTLVNDNGLVGEGSRLLQTPEQEQKAGELELSLTDGLFSLTFAAVR
jgi:hypothetical protein